MRLRTTVAALVAAALTAGIDLLYVWVLVSEGEGDLGETVPRAVVGFLAAASLALAVTPFLAARRIRTIVLAATGAALVLLAFPAIFSIGIPLFVAGIIAIYAAATSQDAANGRPTPAHS
jgi:hypothetical protein